MIPLVPPHVSFDGYMLDFGTVEKSAVLWSTVHFDYLRLRSSAVFYVTPFCSCWKLPATYTVHFL